MSAAPSSLVDVLSRQFHEAPRRCAELEIILSESPEWAGKLEQWLREANAFIDNSGWVGIVEKTKKKHVNR